MGSALRQDHQGVGHFNAAALGQDDQLRTASSATGCCTRRPCSPASAKPELKIVTNGTLLAAHCASMAGQERPA
ncbi:MAG: hypothetical protein WAK57_02260 [Desulfobacterales bacterium]